jgi:negative regulator of replication initiation
MATNIQVTDAVWSELNSRKKPGESFDDVLRRELGIGDVHSESRKPKQDAQPAARTAETAETVALPDDLEAEIDRWRSEMERNDVDDIDTRVRAARAVGQLVVDSGVSRSEAIDELLPEHGWGSSEGTWWEKAGKRRFSEADSIQWDQSAQKYQVVE